MGDGPLGAAGAVNQASASTTEDSIAGQSQSNESNRIDKNSPAWSSFRKKYSIPELVKFPQDDVSGDQPHIEFTIQKFRGPKFGPGSRRHLGEDFAAENIFPAGGNAPTAAGQAAREIVGQPTAPVLAAGPGQQGPTEAGKRWINNAEVLPNISRGELAAMSQAIELVAANTEPVAKIRLFLPHQLNESYALSWSQGDVGFPGQVYETGLAAGIKDLYEAGLVSSEVLGRALGKITGTQAMKELTLRNKGAAINPHMESFFKGVQFRKFTYNFQMFPRTSTESENISKIVRMFKMGAAPANLSGAAGYGRYWLYPNQFLIKYFNMDQTHKIKRCFLENIGVNYGAAGVNQTFKDRRPLQTDLTLNFTELELIQKEDIEEGY